MVMIGLRLGMCAAEYFDNLTKTFNGTLDKKCLFSKSVDMPWLLISKFFEKIILGICSNEGKFI
jgi:hypothetical protein